MVSIISDTYHLARILVMMMMTLILPLFTGSFILELLLTLLLFSLLNFVLSTGLPVYSSSLSSFFLPPFQILVFLLISHTFALLPGVLVLFNILCQPPEHAPMVFNYHPALVFPFSLLFVSLLQLIISLLLVLLNLLRNLSQSCIYFL